MKWVVFLLALSAGVPVMIGAMRANPLARRAALFLFFLLLLNTLEGSLAINVISYEQYRGWTRGMEITAFDLMALALTVHVLLSRPRDFPRKWLSWEGWLFALCVLAAGFSFLASHVPIYALFGFWKIFRGFVVYWVFTQFIDRRERLVDMITCFGLLCLYQLPFVLQQKYLFHLYRATGTLPHMNTLALGMNMLMLPVFAVIFLGREKPRLWHLAVVAAAAFNVLSTVSRGALVSMVATMAICLVFTRRKDLDLRRLIILGCLGLGGLIAGAAASRTIIQRFLEAPKESEETREGFNLCAARMAREFPFGAGINNFSYMIGQTRYGEDAPDLPEGGKDDGVAHHIYWLIASEMGYFGLGCFVLLFAGVQGKALAMALRGKTGLCRAYAAGVFCGLLALHLQGFLEWILFQTNIWFLFCAQLGALTAAGRLDQAAGRERTEGAGTGPSPEPGEEGQPAEKSAGNPFPNRRKGGIHVDVKVFALDEFQPKHPGERDLARDGVRWGERGAGQNASRPGGNGA